MESLQIIMLFYGALSALGTATYFFKQRKETLRRCEDTWLQWTPLLLNMVHAGLITLAYFGYGVFPMPPVLNQICIGLGFLIFSIGFGFGIWSSRSLGQNAIPEIGLKENHTLTENGTFAFCRHPIYLSIIVIWLGSAIVFSGYLLFIGFIIASAIQTFRLIAEEKILSEEFGVQFDQYRKRVPILIPSFLGCSDANDEIERVLQTCR